MNLHLLILKGKLRVHEALGGPGSAPDMLGHAQPAIGPQRPNRRMVLVFLLLAAMLMAAPAGAQQTQPSSTDAQKPAVEDDHAADLPVSLDKIREGLEHAPPAPLLQNLDRRADFRS